MNPILAVLVLAVIWLVMTWHTIHTRFRSRPQLRRVINKRGDDRFVDEHEYPGFTRTDLRRRSGLDKITSGADEVKLGSLGQEINIDEQLREVLEHAEGIDEL